MEVMFPKCSGLDVLKRMVVACVVDESGRMEQVRKRFGTTTVELEG
ncbi:hypothetical protein KFU94_42935 [Chloroflexi bacterium TSY]|nr:hypothetical protein [Chloroflexi bacterium TSY]